MCTQQVLLHPSPPRVSFLLSFLSFFFIFLLLASLTSQSHPHLCNNYEGSESKTMSRGKSSAASSLITLVKTLSRRLLHSAGSVSHSVMNRCFLDRHFSSPGLFCCEQEVVLNLNCIYIDQNVCISFFIQLSPLVSLMSRLTPMSFLHRRDFLCCCGSKVFIQDVEGAERMCEPSSHPVVENVCMYLWLCCFSFSGRCKR